MEKNTLFSYPKAKIKKFKRYYDKPYENKAFR